MAEQNPKWKPPKTVQKSHKKTMKEIGAKLEKLRGSMAASKLSDKVEISRNSYRPMEQGKIYFSMENFLKVLEYHEISISDFFSTDIDKL